MDDWQQKGSSLARTSLSTCHHVPASHDNGYAVLLHWSRLLVSRFGYILHKDGSEACPSEGLDGAWNVVAGGGHWNLIILGKVDAAGDARGVELSRVAVSLGHVHLLGLALLVGEGVGALLAHVTLLATLAAAHWLWTVGNLMAFFPAPPALGWLRAVGPDVAWLPALSAELWFGTVRAAVAFLAAVEALFRLRAVRGHVPLLAAVAALVISSTSSTPSGTVPGEVAILSTLAATRVSHDFLLKSRAESLKKCYQAV